MATFSLHRAASSAALARMEFKGQHVHLGLSLGPVQFVIAFALHTHNIFKSKPLERSAAILCKHLSFVSVSIAQHDNMVTYLNHQLLIPPHH